MRGLPGRRATGLAATLAALALCATASATEGVPHAITGGVSNVHAGVGQLEGKVNPEGVESSYFFEYGLTTAYGGKTTPVPVGKGKESIDVGQTVSGVVPGLHYRIVVTCAGCAAPIYGGPKEYGKGKSKHTKFVVPTGKENEITVHYGEAPYLTGTLVGSERGDQTLSFQSTPYPFVEAFTPVPGTTVTSPTGSFTFKGPRVFATTEFRAQTHGTRPLYSPFIVVHVSPLISLHVKKAHGAGSYRLYGTVAPYIKGAVVVIQQLLPQKAGSKREGPAPNSVGNTVLKHSSSKLGSFSTTLIFTGTYHYRAFIRLPKGTLVSGHSNDVLIRGPKTIARKRSHRKRK